MTTTKAQHPAPETEEPVATQEPVATPEKEKEQTVQQGTVVASPQQVTQVMPQQPTRAPRSELDEFILSPDVPVDFKNKLCEIKLQEFVIKRQLALAEHLHKSGAFSGDVKNAPQAFVKMKAGAEMGMSEMESMTSLYIINGHVTMWGVALSKRLVQHGWEIQYVDCDEMSATVNIEKGDRIHTYTATLEELLSLNSRAVKFAPRDKLKWHALSRLARFYAPEVFGGVAYLAEEFDEGNTSAPRRRLAQPSVTEQNEADEESAKREEAKEAMQKEAESLMGEISSKKK